MSCCVAGTLVFSSLLFQDCLRLCQLAIILCSWNHAREHKRAVENCFVFSVLPKSQYSSKQRTQSEAIGQKLHFGLEVSVWRNFAVVSCTTVLPLFYENDVKNFLTDLNMWLLIASVKIPSNITFNLASCFTSHVDAAPFSVSALDALIPMCWTSRAQRRSFFLRKSRSFHCVCYGTVWQWG